MATRLTGHLQKKLRKSHRQAVVKVSAAGESRRKRQFRIAVNSKNGCSAAAQTTKDDGLRHGRPMAYSTGFFAAGDYSDC